MGDEYAIFAQSAGTALVALMATDGYQRAKRAVAELWGRVRPAEATAVCDQLDETRAALLQARARGDEERERELAAGWQDRLAVLFATDSHAVGTLHQGLAAAAADGAEHGRHGIGGIRITARARGDARVFQAGRDQHIVDR